jgi:hypothetical protein
VSAFWKIDKLHKALSPHDQDPFDLPYEGELSFVEDYFY